MRLLTVICTLAAMPGCGDRAVTDTIRRAGPGSFISVETSNKIKPGASISNVTAKIMADIQALLLNNNAYAQITHSHGFASPTNYYLKFDGTCAGRAEFVAAVRSEIAKSTSAPIACVDEKQVE